MILVFTEDEKHMIESMGLMVIEYKRIIYCSGKAIEIVMSNLDEIFQDITDAISLVIDDVCEAFKDLSYSLESFRTFDRPRYPMVRQYSKCKTPDRNLIWKPKAKARNGLCTGK